MYIHFFTIITATLLTAVTFASYRCPKLCICQPEKHAICDGKTYKSIPRGLSMDLTLLNLKHNLIRRVKYKHLSYSPDLKHLLLMGNQITSIEPGAFRDLRHLISLSLSKNNLHRLAPNTFKGLVNVQVFSLRQNRLRHIDGLFTGLRSLQLLNLGGNRITKLGDKTFYSNNYLIVLDLHSNRIKHIHPDAFKGLPFLKYLVLRDNPLRKMELDFRLNFHLELLDLTKCRLRHIVKGLPYSINDLRLGENNITKIRKRDFQTVKKIRLLVLNGNRIQSVEKRAFSNLSQLHSLHMSTNLLQRLPENLPTSLHGLYVNNNNITDVKSRDFRSNIKLQYLFMRQNNIHNIDPDSFRSMKFLKSLDVSNNKIDALKPQTFKGLKKLQVLDLSNNPLSMLESRCFNGLDDLHILQMSSVDSKKTNVSQSVFKDLQSLLFLDLSNSSLVVKPLAQNPHGLDNLVRLEDLNFMDNNLDQLPSNFPKYFPHLKMIKLSGNPWHCDRSIYWLTQWMRNRSVEFFAKDWIRCASPEALFGLPIYALTLKDLQKQKQKLITPRPIGIESIDISLVHEDHETLPPRKYEIGVPKPNKKHTLKVKNTQSTSNKYKTQVQIWPKKPPKEKKKQKKPIKSKLKQKETLEYQELVDLEKDHMKFAARFARKEEERPLPSKGALFDDSSGVVRHKIEDRNLIL